MSTGFLSRKPFLPLGKCWFAVNAANTDPADAFDQVRGIVNDFNHNEQRQENVSARERAALSFDTIQVWTIGHSTLAAEEFIARLQSFQIATLIDVRSFPGSRRYPHFNRENLRSSLATAGIDYLHMPELGGRRKAKPDSLNMAWRNESFRGYADYMETKAFREGIERLLKLAGERRTAIMCAEAVWWRCHRSLISDYLKAEGVKVIHILGVGKSEEHPFTSAAQIVNGKLSYHGVLASRE